MNDQNIIKSISNQVKNKLINEGSGHDWWHVYRVWKTAKFIAQKEKIDSFIVELAALLHDIADWKLHDGDEKIGPQKAKEILLEHQVNPEIIDQTCEIISTIAFKGAKVNFELNSIEAKIVQDADRLDAIGAIGIARTFAYGGHKNRPIYDPEINLQLHNSKEDYIKNQSPTINHFYEKLLLLKDLMNTQTAKQIANDRHKYMEQFLDKFFKEWDCNDIMG